MASSVPLDILFGKAKPMLRPESQETCRFAVVLSSGRGVSVGRGFPRMATSPGRIAAILWVCHPSAMRGYVRRLVLVVIM